jgi:hypothetical protein
MVVIVLPKYHGYLGKIGTEAVERRENLMKLVFLIVFRSVFRTCPSYCHLPDLLNVESLLLHGKSPSPGSRFFGKLTFKVD